jgi:adenine-specific DNA-methyltransferase
MEIEMAQQESLLPEQNIDISTAFHENDSAVLFHGDVIDGLRDVPDGSVRLAITSPPYNIGKEYETTKTLDDYLSEQGEIIEKIVRVIADDGSICWQVGNYVLNGEICPLDIHFYGIFKALGFKLRNRIIWHFNHGLHATKRFSGRYETLLWFTKSDEYVFHLDPVRVPSKYPGKRSYKGSDRGRPSGNPLGKNPSDFWEFLAQEWETGIWDIPNVKANHPEKTAHPCQFPIELVERCVLSMTNEADWVLDPYAGAGSTLIAALRHKRKAMGCEKEDEYVDITRSRIQAFARGELRIRPLGKPVHQPSGKEKVAQIPDEWLQGKEEDPT